MIRFSVDTFFPGLQSQQQPGQQSGLSIFNNIGSLFSGMSGLNSPPDVNNPLSLSGAIAMVMNLTKPSAQQITPSLDAYPPAIPPPLEGIGFGNVGPLNDFSSLFPGLPRTQPDINNPLSLSGTLALLASLLNPAVEEDPPLPDPPAAADPPPPAAQPAPAQPAPAAQPAAPAAPAAKPKDATDQLIDSVYHDYLGRDAEDGGRAFWRQYMQQGHTVEEFRKGVQNSDEYRGIEVNRAYHDLLGREAEPDGLQHWKEFLAQGKTEQELQAAIKTSPEYRNRAVDLAYQDLLGRHAEDAGKANWVKFLNDGHTEQEMRQAIMGSEEYKTKHP